MKTNDQIIKEQFEITNSGRIVSLPNLSELCKLFDSFRAEIDDHDQINFKLWQANRVAVDKVDSLSKEVTRLLSGADYLRTIHRMREDSKAAGDRLDAYAEQVAKLKADNVIHVGEKAMDKSRLKDANALVVSVRKNAADMSTKIIDLESQLSGVMSPSNVVVTVGDLEKGAAELKGMTAQRDTAIRVADHRQFDNKHLSGLLRSAKLANDNLRTEVKELTAKVGGKAKGHLRFVKKLDTQTLRLEAVVGEAVIPLEAKIRSLSIKHGVDDVPVANIEFIDFDYVVTT